ncbi:unnamed protein product [Blepharisma stoltei]|uniref:Peptidase C1A papain C-terminal domain-containing protein n=1 Tax=Blepharisma stoltei TaxID=1481888 RepID=A0AAU9IL99_9CILI|nr:unnamed protein product [Blepharisma stoltei]
MKTHHFVGEIKIKQSWWNKMKYLLFVSLYVLALSGPAVEPKDSDLVAPQEMIDEINRVQDLWIASSEWVGNMTFAQAKLYASSKLEAKKFPEKDWGALLDYLSIPASFDSRTQWPNCTKPLWDGQNCNGGWAFAAAETMTDRFCIATKGAFNITFSPLYLIICDDTMSEKMCYGGSAESCWDYMRTTGITSIECFPYHPGDWDQWCPDDTCRWGTKITLYKTKSVKTFTSPSSIQAEILQNGPIEATMTVYADFQAYKGGIYKHTTGKLVGYTSVKIIGWGNQSGTNYWIAGNSWGSTWGMQGYFNIAFGQCGIDSAGVAGPPDLSNIPASKI